MGADRSGEARLAAGEGFIAERLTEALASLGAPARLPGARFVDRYLDTRARALGRAGLSARAREQGRRRSLRVQPSYLAPELIPEEGRSELGALLGPGEEIAGTLRRLLRGALGLELRGPIVCLCELAVARRAWRLSLAGGATVEVRLDRLVARRAGERGGLAFLELELLLLSGEPDALAAAVARLLEAVPGLAPATTGRRRRAFAHAGVPPLRHAPATAPIAPLDPTDLVARRVCARELAAIRGYEAGARVGLDPEFVHKGRVATRRLRAALRAFAPCFDARTLGLLARGMKWLADALGAVRDLDVQLLELGGWRATLGAEPASGWQDLREVLEQRRASARAALLRVLDAPRYRTLLERADAAFVPSAAPARRPGHAGAVAAVESAEAAIARRAKRFLAQTRRCRAAPSPEAIHRLRILGKKLRYACEFFAPLYGPDFVELCARLSRLQDALGEQQDSVVLGRLARSLADEALRSGEGSAAYLHVLGALSGASQIAASAAGARFEASFEAAGGTATIKQIRRAARGRAETVRAALAPPPARGRGAGA
jgi:CHAD domain-containing protein